MYKKVEDLAKKMKSATYFKYVLTLTISEVTGCSCTTILRYMWKKCIYVVNIMDKLNYLAIDKTFKNTQKSEWHEEIIRLFLEKK